MKLQLTSYIFLKFIKYIKTPNFSCFGDWGLGIGDWGLGIGPNPQSPIPNPHPHILLFIKITL